MSGNGELEPTMVERVAIAIWSCNRPEGAPDYDQLNNMEQFQVEAIARECIRSMLEPTKDMIKLRTDQAIWTRMIEAALKED